MTKGIFTITVFSLLSLGARADGPAFVDLSPGDFKGAIEDISGVWAYTSVSPASSGGGAMIGEVGFVAGLAQTPKINSLSNEAEPGTNISTLPEANILALFRAPFGLTAEAELLPQTTISGVTAKSWSLAAKWTFTDVFPVLPVDLAVKTFYTSAEFTFSGNVGTAPSVFTTFDVTTDMIGVQAQVSKPFLFVEPYLTVGYLQSAGHMVVNGSTQVFQENLSDGESASKTVDCPFFAVGADLNLWILRVGLEAGTVFGNTKGTAKLALYF